MLNQIPFLRPCNNKDDAEWNQNPVVLAPQGFLCYNGKDRLLIQILYIIPGEGEFMLTKEQVEHVALLARLEFSDEENEKYAAQLSSILKHIEKLDELDTTDVPPTAHVLPIKNVFREDKVGQHLSNEEVLQNAPESEDGSFRVPKIF